MEDILIDLKEILTSAIDIKVDKAKLSITMQIKSDNIRGDLATPKEVENMLKIFGGLKEEIPMEIEIDNKNQKINLKFNNKNDLDKIQKLLDKIWDRATHMIEQAIAGDFSVIKDLGDIE